MDSVSAALSSVSATLNIASCLCNSSDKHMSYIYLLEENLDSLRNTMIELVNINKDVKRRVELAEEQLLQPTNEVKGWLELVELLEKDVNEILLKGAELIQNRCFRNRIPKSIRSRYKLGKVINKKLDAVRELLNKGRFTTVAERLPAAAAQVDKRLMEMTVGLDTRLGKVWEYLEERDVGVIGLYGMGGVGKTTLLKKINNKFRKRRLNFNVVLWIVVSKEGNVQEIQEAVRRKLGISDGIWSEKTEDERATEIHNILMTKKFILLLDDLWERLDLLRVGIPLPNNQNRCKVVFATRSEDICYQMGAHARIRVECLPPKDALELFRYNVGEDAWKSNNRIPELAEVVSQECKGLPLALITIGRAMSSRKDPREWEHAIKLLRSYPSKFSGMGDHVFPILGFSYESLSDDTIRTCFLYCSLFPEGHNIKKDKLIELWIGEGFLDESDNIFQARKLGVYIIRTLILACLLEFGESEEFVQMHDVIRDMAIWLSSEQGTRKNKILVQHFTNEIKPSRLAKWMEADKISVWCHVGNLVRTPLCPNLVTLVIRSLFGTSFPHEFFKSMKTLKVLDLSWNWSLKEVPAEIGELINLHYLDLSSTAIEALPVELRNLKKLRFLLLDRTPSLTSFPGEIMNGLTSLQVFSEYKQNTRYYYLENKSFRKEKTLLDEMKCLEHLQDVSITLFSSNATRILVNTPELHKRIRRLSLSGFLVKNSFVISLSFLGRMKHLERLELYGYAIEQITNNSSSYSKLTQQVCFRNLHHLSVRWCGISDMSWIVHARNLQTLKVIGCNSIEMVVSKNLGVETREILSNLRILHLEYLPKLKSICWIDLGFPSLMKIQVKKCSNLTRLPLASSSDNEETSNLVQIRGECRWWNRLQWDDEAIKRSISSRFIPL